MRWISVGAVALLLVGPPAEVVSQQEPGGAASPVAVATDFLQAYRAMAWDAAALRMHPEALADFRLRVMLLTESDRDRDALIRLVDGRSVEELESLRPERLFDVVMTALGREAPGLINALVSREMEVVGAVWEGPERAHVVYRVIPSLPGDPPRMQVMTLRRLENDWRVTTADELDVLGTALGAIPRTTGGSGASTTPGTPEPPARRTPNALGPFEAP